jgi:hypothetical protein
VKTFLMRRWSFNAASVPNGSGKFLRQQECRFFGPFRSIRHAALDGHLVYKFPSRFPSDVKNAKKNGK